MATSTVSHPVPAAPAYGQPPDHGRRSAGLLTAAGVLFLAYPALRPYSDETTLAGAEAMASTTWVVSHLLGVAAFALLAAGLARGSGRSGRPAAGMAGLGAVLVLPYYGAEAFGLQVIAQRALEDQDASLLLLAEQFRMGALPLAVFGAGLLALAVAGVALAVATWRRGGAARLGGLLVATGLVLYAPQFLAPAGVRIGHGAVLGAGLLLLAVGRRAVAPASGPGLSRRRAGGRAAAGNRGPTTAR